MHWSLPCACVYVALFAHRLTFNHYAIAHAYNAANAHAQDSDRAHWTRGGTHIWRHTGMCRIFGSVFLKKSLDMGPIFHEKIRNYGSNLFEPRKILKRIAKNGYRISEKSLNMGTFFLEKLPFNMGMGPELPAVYPRPIQIWVPPPVVFSNYLPFVLCTILYTSVKL